MFNVIFYGVWILVPLVMAFGLGVAIWAALVGLRGLSSSRGGPERRHARTSRAASRRPLPPRKDERTRAPWTPTAVAPRSDPLGLRRTVEASARAEAASVPGVPGAA
jgi:hypothetical protein